MPQGGVNMIHNQLNNLAAKRPETLSIGAIAGLTASLWTTNNAVKAMFEGLNIVYGEPETRGPVRLYLSSFAFTLYAFLFSIIAVAAVGLVPPLLAYLNLDRESSIIAEAIRWSLLLSCVTAGILLLYRYGPSKPRAGWNWLARGAILATFMWMLASWAFSVYLQNFSHYDATFGALGAILGFMLWIWLSVAIILMGAALNAEIERQLMLVQPSR
jgi:membrane protein